MLSVHRSGSPVVAKRQEFGTDAHGRHVHRRVQFPIVGSLKLNVELLYPRLLSTRECQLLSFSRPLRLRHPLPPRYLGHPIAREIYAMPATLNLSDAHTDAHTRRTLSDLSLSVAKCRRIVVVTGAGISCSCGIPVSFFVSEFRAYSEACCFD